MPSALVAPPEGWVALSIRQPWAALIVAGVKSIEVRTWPTSRRGPVLIHASKSPDDRSQGWSLVTTPELQALAELRGGIVGLVRLADCRRYADRDSFVRDQTLHLNDPDWFRDEGLFGHVFADVRALPFTSCAGKVLYFDVPFDPLSGRKPR